MDKNYKVGIVGYGYVGKCIHRLLKEDVVAVYDPFLKNIADDYGVEIGRDRSDFRDLDMVVVSVMTASAKDGSCDVSILEETIEWLHEITPFSVILIKSAVTPGKIYQVLGNYNTKRPVPKIVVSPEYVGESKYFTPFWKYPDPKNMEGHTWQIFGGDEKDTSLCIDIFKRRMSVDCIHLQTDLTTACLCKYMENSFFATKVTFCNMWFDIAKSWGVDYNKLRECWLADTRINRNHTLVFPKDRGYGGKCFPKDIKAIIQDAKKKGVNVDLLEAVDKVNEGYRNGEY
jgi:UDPglucose 6-dehydrogenase